MSKKPNFQDLSNEFASMPLLAKLDAFMPELASANDKLDQMNDDEVKELQIDGDVHVHSEPQGSSSAEGKSDVSKALNLPDMLSQLTGTNDTTSTSAETPSKPTIELEVIGGVFDVNGCASGENVPFSSGAHKSSGGTSNNNDRSNNNSDRSSNNSSTSNNNTNNSLEGTGGGIPSILKITKPSSRRAVFDGHSLSVQEPSKGKDKQKEVWIKEMDD